MRRMQNPILFKAYKPSEITATLTLGDVIDEVTKIKSIINDPIPQGWNVFKFNFDAFDDSSAYEGSSIIYLQEGHENTFLMIIKYVEDDVIKGIIVDRTTKILDISSSLNIHGFRISLELIAVNQAYQTDY